MSMQQRKDEILAKRAKLAELKKQRELRQKEFTVTRQSIGSASELTPPSTRSESRQDIDDIVNKLIGPDKTPSTPKRFSTPSPARSSSHATAGKAEQDTSDGIATSPESQAPAPPATSAPQALSFAPLTTVYEIRSDEPKREILTYSKGVQTNEQWTQDSISPTASDAEADSFSPQSQKRRSSRRQRERDDEIRQNIRREIEEELRALQEQRPASAVAEAAAKQQHNFPARALSNEELEAVTSSSDFLDFVDRTSKVIERALDEEYDVLADYRLGTLAGADDDEDDLGTKGRRGRGVKEILQFYDERWSRKRMITDLGFSPKFPELLLSSYTKNPSASFDPDGLVQIWNLHMRDRPEYTFHATSDILTAQFSPFHPSYILGGSYSGQILLWDTRSRSTNPVQRSPLTGIGHTHPVYSLSIVGTQNAHNIVSASTDGVVCTWSMDMLSHPQETLELTAPPAPLQSSAPLGPTPYTRPEELAPTSTAFPSSDPTYFLAGTEEGPIALCHRYDRAGAKAGVDSRAVYRGHTAPVMSLDFHHASGPLDLGDLVLSAALDWSVKVWRVRTPATTNINGTATPSGISSNKLGPSTLSRQASSSFAAPLIDTLTDSLQPLSTTPALASPAAGSSSTSVSPILDLARNDAVYDAKWSPTHPGVFALVDGAGTLEIWDLAVDAEVPAARVVPTARADDGSVIAASSNAGVGAGLLGANGGAGSAMLAQRRALNRCAWEPHDGRRVAVGGLDGVVSVFEVGHELGGADGVRAGEWDAVKKLVARAE